MRALGIVVAIAAALAILLLGGCFSVEWDDTSSGGPKVRAESGIPTLYEKSGPCDGGTTRVGGSAPRKADGYGGGVGGGTRDPSP